MKRASDRHKSYADLHRSSWVFKSRDRVFLRIKPKRSSLRLGKYKKLAYRYCGPYEILRRIGEESYELALPAHLHVRNVSHVSPLKAYVANPEHVLSIDDTILVNQQEFQMESEQILDMEEKQVHHRNIKEVLIQGKDILLEMHLRKIGIP